MIGRSNLQQAVPLTFGYKAAVWLAGIDRHLQRLDQMKRRVLMGEFGGAVGTLASLGEQGLPVQRGVMEKLGLVQPPISWHTVRDTIAEVGCFLGILCGLLDKIASDVKVMMMTELNEVQEPAGGGGRGASSTMPQKRNPISCVYITACSSVVRQYRHKAHSHARYHFERAPSDGCHFLARLHGSMATRFWIKGCFDAESDGAAIRRAVGAFRRNSYDIARGTRSGRPAHNHSVRSHHWLLLCGISNLPFPFSHANEHQCASRTDGFSAGGAFRRSSGPRRSARKAQRNSHRGS